jgi:hypothetical protein
VTRRPEPASRQHRLPSRRTGALGAGLISAFSVLDLDLGHGTTGLYVGALDEQHPWLYNALALTKHDVAEEYRQRTCSTGASCAAPTTS